VTLRDVLFLTRPKPSKDRESLFKRLADKQLATPDTWEVGLSAAKNEIQKRNVWKPDRNRKGVAPVDARRDEKVPEAV
jgi:hypothetical protein